MGFLTDVRRAWNAFMNRDPTANKQEFGRSSYNRTDMARFSRGNERSIATSVYNRIALDVSSINIKHCRLDERNRYIEDIPSHMNECFTLSANVDQTSRAFFQDLVISLLDEGHVCVVPTDTTENIHNTDGYDIYEMRTGKVVEWYPTHVKVRVYNEAKGKKEDVVLPKRAVAIIENPFYSVMNENNSTLQRLIRKLSLLDITDEQSASGKLDMIVQLPFAVKGDLKRAEAERRRKDIEEQLVGSKYGIAYIDGTEKITQLNRSLENNLQKQIEYLTNLFFSQIGLTQAILDQTADETTMLNYFNRTIEPIVSAICLEFKRKFISASARTRGQSIEYFRDPFKLTPISEIAKIADTMTRNCIMTSNEIRQKIGLEPSADPNADALINNNLNQSNEEISADQQYDQQGGPYEEV